MRNAEVLVYSFVASDIMKYPIVVISRQVTMANTHVRKLRKMMEKSIRKNVEMT